MTTASWLCSAGRNTVHPPPAARRQTVRGGVGSSKFGCRFEAGPDKTASCGIHPKSTVGRSDSVFISSN